MEISDQQYTSSAISSKKQSQITADFDTFLRMLTTQMQNQDPLNPMEADAFASQLATFSMVEQQTRTNQNLEALLATQSGASIMDFAHSIGKSVSHDEPFQYSGAPVRLSWQGSLAGDLMQVVFLNEAGDVAATKILTQGQNGITWDGLDEGGSPVPVGRYSAAIQSVSDGALMDMKVLAHSEIEEARIEDDRVRFVLTDGTVISQDAVMSIR